MKYNNLSHKFSVQHFLLVLLFTSFTGIVSTFGQNTTVTYGFGNAEITTDGTNDFYEADLLISADADFVFGENVVFFNFNTDAFGESPNITVDQEAQGANPDFIINTTFFDLGVPALLTYTPASGISLEGVFNVSVSQNQQQTATNVTTTPKRLLHFRVQYVDSSIDPMISFATFDPGTQTLSSVLPGPPATFNVPETIFDNSGASIAIGCTGITTTWVATNGGEWDNGAPGLEDFAIIDTDYDTSTSGDINACELTINSMATLTITDGNFINVENSITNDGTIQVDNQGSIVQTEEDAITTNNGSITVSKTTPSIIARNFLALSSPMSAETRDGVYNGSRAVFNLIPDNFIPFVIDFDEFPEFMNAENFLDDNNDYFLASTGSEALPTPGIGQWVFPSPTHDAPIASYDLDYTQGTLNSGTYTIPINYNGPATVNNLNLLGNPYASAIDVTAFIDANNSVNEVYYWDHITNPTPDLPGAGGNGDGTSNFSMNDISMRNAMMGVAAVNGGIAPGQFMASGQGFSIKADQGEMVSNTPVVFTNSMRVVGNNDDFRSSEVESNLDKLWLNLTTSAYEDVQSQVGIGFTDNATQGYDSGYDSKRLATFLSLFSTLESGEHLTIQGRELFDASMEIPLGFSTIIEEEVTYTISIDKTEGVNIEQSPIFLIDHLLNTSTNLKESSYTFTSVKTIQPDRFTVVFKEQSLSLEDQTLNEGITLYPNPASSQITLLYNGNSDLEKATIFNVNGKLVKEIDLRNYSSNQQIDINTLAKGMYFINIISNQKLITKKFIVR